MQFRDLDSSVVCVAVCLAASLMVATAGAVWLAAEALLWLFS